MEEGRGGGEGKLSAGEEEKRGERRGDLFDLQRRREREREEKFAGWRREESQETGEGEEARNLQHPPKYVSFFDRDGDYATPKILVPPAVFSCWESGEELKIVVAGGEGEPRPSYRQKKVGKGEERFLAES